VTPIAVNNSCDNDDNDNDRIFSSSSGERETAQTASHVSQSGCKTHTHTER
jgi:hypothetical protein